jgi:hypothetical protein
MLIPLLSAALVRRLVCRDVDAVWHLAPLASFGMSRRMASGAVWHFAPSGIPRRLAFGAVSQLAPFELTLPPSGDKVGDAYSPSRPIALLYGDLCPGIAPFGCETA